MFKENNANFINFEALKRSWGSILSVIEHAVFHFEIPPYTYCKCPVQSIFFNDPDLYLLPRIHIHVKRGHDHQTELLNDSGLKLLKCQTPGIFYHQLLEYV